MIIDGKLLFRCWRTPEAFQLRPFSSMSYPPDCVMLNNVDGVNNDGTCCTNESCLPCSYGLKSSLESKTTELLLFLKTSKTDHTPDCAKTVESRFSLTPSISVAAMYCTPSILGPDPPTVNRLNACSYQQSALTTYQNYQYAVFYTPKSKIALPDATTPRYVNLSRRAISPKLGSWETLTFTDYEQTTDDGHNTISMGISHGDGTIHLSFDHHCDTYADPSNIQYL